MPKLLLAEFRSFLGQLGCSIFLGHSHGQPVLSRWPAVPARIVVCVADHDQAPKRWALRPGFVRDCINHAIQFQVELDQFFVQVGDVVFVALNRLDVELTLFILARIERQEVPPFPSRNEHAALNLRHVFLGHAFEPSPDVYRLVERALRLGATVIVDPSGEQSSQSYFGWTMNSDGMTMLPVNIS